MDLVTIAKFVVLPIALGAVAVVLVLGLVNMARGGSPMRSQKLMQWRVLLQAVALCFVLATIILMNHG
ncbi:twin transmembrane helix small protein [Ancylobacter mangrovi]|uniref:Twin transmembrane helix small protein n=1 Tax=Ancylobacter mangrovi TaxID=2972472 RepID=A0A9X2PFS4_9HYPH|nr:twin transmembrane helix small protein [Ancylobacter mangrovi]MCS0495195.1 twin transmembrane helix small protein [Ancylobacter mangrovi]MCS0502590.1 twin transmembrane helix small protein [Ancylobacter mangrovi]